MIIPIKNTVCQSQVLFYILKRFWNLDAFIDKELVSCQISAKIILEEINSQSLILNYQRKFRNILLLAFLRNFWNFKTNFSEMMANKFWKFWPQAWHSLKLRFQERLKFWNPSSPIKYKKPSLAHSQDILFDF